MAADLVPLFQRELELCRVASGQNVLIFTDPQFPYPEYAQAAFAACRALGANPYLMVGTSWGKLADRLVHASWCSADLILGMSTVPRGIGSWMYTEVHTAALHAGARALMIQEPLPALVRMMPNEEVRRRGLAGAALLQAAREIRLISADGTELSLRKDGRKAMYQCGIADEPGRWDHWPSGLVTCAPLEWSAEGTFVVKPGDVLLGLWRHAQTEVRLIFEGGKLRRIEGGADALALRSYLERAGDEGAFRVAHVGWGTDPRADWSQVGMDSESKYGTVLLALGRNTFDAPAAYCGMGGQNASEAHCDICCRNVSLDLDGQPIIRAEQFLVPELA